MARYWKTRAAALQDLESTVRQFFDLTQPCPHCGAGPWEWCVTKPTGKRWEHLHSARHIRWRAQDVEILGPKHLTTGRLGDWRRSYGGSDGV